MDVYLVVVLANPTDKAKFDEGAVPTIIVQPTAVIAKDEQQASARAMRLVPTEHADKDHLLEVRVLPFGRVAR